MVVIMLFKMAAEHSAELRQKAVMCLAGQTLALGQLYSKMS